MQLSFKLISLISILLVTIISGLYPFFKKSKDGKVISFPIGESIAAGVFLGAGLIHMLGDATSEFSDLHIEYPIALVIAGATFLFFLLLEHIGRELYHHGTRDAFALLAVVMLSIHSFFAGAGLGVAGSLSTGMLILFAILAHKWAASFSLSVQINKTDLSTKMRMTMFLIFAAMAPLGILCGSAATHYFSSTSFFEPVFSSLAAGTFLYLGTLHGLERAVMIKQCCNLKGFLYVILGFVLMAVVAVWT